MVMPAALDNQIRAAGVMENFQTMNARMSAALAWGGVLLAGALWGGGALVAQFLIDGGIAPQSLSLARFALGVPLLWWLHWRAQRMARPPMRAGATWPVASGSRWSAPAPRWRST
jgi:drug/metabolite transporter (DMT)-like permease